ncbi:hypothetical protein HG536_0H00880 [Torulaspora globosa]|uniref:Uncharacterized protein n=1 Tax=Torulaspora globosa TaxID=48254 RepID=A0A7G3ZMH7_9SACH|nr:uncharacterized protein HG536_0H00880 [Torulaspora globosa]QLL34713.1 hypothetical protein HG536_0H00880 [Torulaspora globosa]
MNQDARESIESIKDLLLKYNPSKIGPDNQEEVLKQFVECCQELFVYFQKKTDGISDSLALLATDTFSIWVLRTSQVISHKKIDTSGYIKVVKDEILTFEGSTVIFEYVVDFWKNGNPAFINALKNLFTKLLHLMRLIHPRTECDKLFSSWLDRTFQVPSDLAVQYYLIEALAEELDLYPVLQKRPTFVDESLRLMQSDILSNPVGKSLCKILTNAFYNHFGGDLSNLPSWLGFWQEPVIFHLSNQKCRKSIELYILQPMFKEVPPNAFRAFVKGIPRHNPSVLLSVIRVGQELGIEEEPFHNDRLIPIDMIGSFLKLDESKLAAFELLTFATKKSSPIHSNIFHLIKENLTIFFVDTRIEVRNYFCSSFKHFIYRIRDSAHSLHKRASSLKRAGKFPAEQKAKFGYVQECQSFLEWLLGFLKLQICPGTQYQRNDVALKLFNIIIESGLDASIPAKYLDMKNPRSYPFSVPIFRDNSIVRLLLDCLASNFADIRQMAKMLLLQALEGSDSSILKKSIDWNYLKTQADSLLRQYQYSDIGAALESTRFCAAPDKVAFVEGMIDTLHEKICNSKEDFLRHIHEPISGYLTSLTLILEDNQLEEIITGPIVEKCIEIVLINWSAVKHVICHESCEDNLWMMYPDGNIDAQLVLSTAFRTTKESSMLLRVLLSKYALSPDQLIVIGDFLINQLFDIRHSGAFQSVTPTFSVLCLRCKKENASQLLEWLRTVLESVEVKTQNVTRRSGGIPPMLTVILSAESGKERPLLKYAFERLIKIASTAMEEHQDKVDLPQVNAFNCIKAIFTESKLSQASEPYTPAALSLALKTFDSDTWALRNCSIMLFTSLQNRLFGKSGKSVSARMFFTRYPGIREDLLEILRPASTVTKDRSQIESTFLVLSVLLRLKPTPGYKGLDAFNSEVKKSLESSNWKIRELAARCISSLAENPIEISRELADRMNIKHQNSLHGYLLAISEMIPSLKSFNNEQLSGLIETLHRKCNELLGHNKCFLTAKLYISLMGNILEFIDDDIFRDQQDSLLNYITQFFNQHSRLYTINGSKQICLAAALETLFKYGEGECVSTLLEQAICSPFYEVQEVALRFAMNSHKNMPHITKTFIDSIIRLANDEDIAPSVRSLSLRVLKNLDEKTDLHLLMDIIEKPPSEDLQVAAIESLGKNVTLDNVEILEKLSEQYYADGQPVDFRIACFQSMIDYPEVSNNVRLLLILNQMLSDDDEDIRLAVASSLNRIFRLTGDSETLNPVETSRMLLTRIVKHFDVKLVAENVIRILKEFFEGYDLFAPEIRGNCVFETEKDNQFRNDFELNLQYARLLQITGYDDQFVHWLVALKDKVIAYLHATGMRDGPFGWVSSGEVFSRLLLLRALLALIGTRHILNFDQVLIDSRIHPVILNHEFLDSINLSTARLNEMSLS